MATLQIPSYSSLHRHCSLALSPQWAPAPPSCPTTHSPLTFDHADIVGSIPNGKRHGFLVLLNQLYHLGLLQGCHPAADNSFAGTCCLQELQLHVCLQCVGLEHRDQRKPPSSEETAAVSAPLSPLKVHSLLLKPRKLTRQHTEALGICVLSGKTLSSSGGRRLPGCDH